jgi:hypothetical protein
MRKCQKRLMHMVKETYSYGKRDLFIWQKRPIHMKQQTYSNWRTWGMRKCQKRPIIRQKRPIIRIKETYYTGVPEVCVSVRRGLLSRQKRPSIRLRKCQKRPSVRPKSLQPISFFFLTYIPLCFWERIDSIPQKNCIIRSKETYYKTKRDLW